MTKRILGLTLATALLAPTLAWAADPVAPVAVPAAPASPATPAVPAGNRQANTLQGRVTAVDTTAKTITVGRRRDNSTTTVTLTSDAKVLVTKPATLTDIKVGDSVSVFGSNLTAGATTVEATRVAIQAAAPKAPAKTTARTGFHRNRVDGTVTATTPALTIKTAGDVTVTVTTTGTTRYERLSSGALSDVAVGSNVQVRLSAAGATTATEVRVTPAGGNNQGGGAQAGGRRRRGRRNATAPAETTPVPTTPAPAVPAAP